MRLRYLFLGIVTLAASSCKWTIPHVVTGDTLKYRYKKWGLESSPCRCEFFIKFPLFNGDEKLLNDTILKRIGVTDTSTDDFMRMIVPEYRYHETHKNKEVNGNEYQYYYTKSITIIDKNSSLITFNFKYGDGNDPHAEIFSTSFINWNLLQNKTISLADILKKGYKEKLTKIADTIFRKNENLNDTASLTTNNFLKDGQFAPNNNFLITTVGIKFLYNRGEIKHRSADSTVLLIPYSKIKSLLLPHTVIEQYLK